MRYSFAVYKAIIFFLFCESNVEHFFQEKSSIYRLFNSMSPGPADNTGTLGKAIAKSSARQRGGQQILHYSVCEVTAREQRKENQGVYSR